MRADRPCHAKVFWHPVGQDDTPWLAGHNLAWLAGAPFEDTAAALRLILAGVTDRYPRIRFIVPHLGGTIPFLLARVTRKSTAEITGGLRSMYYDTVSGSPDALTAPAAPSAPTAGCSAPTTPTAANRNSATTSATSAKAG